MARMIEELEGQLDAIAVCIRSEGLPVFLQGAWPDLPDILSEAATQLRRLRKIVEEGVAAAPTTGGTDG